MQKFVAIAVLLFCLEAKAEDCKKHIFLNLNLTEALRIRTVDLAEQARLQQLAAIASAPGQSLRVQPDLNPILKSKGDGLWKLEVYTQTTKGVPVKLVAASKEWASNSESIRLDEHVTYPTSHDKCLPLMVVATEKRGTSPVKTELVRNLEHDEAVGTAVSPFETKVGIHGWRNHKPGFNAVILERTEEKVSRMAPSIETARKFFDEALSKSQSQAK